MEKILLTCFLALLCLYGSATTARVADSPTDGADLVDKVSGPHRGGEIRPDTFPYDEFGLFDKYLDPGAGGETSGSLPAPVTVSTHQIRKDHTTPKSGKHRASDTGHPTPLPSPVSACPPWRGLPSQYIGHPTPSIRHRSSFSLVDQYLDPGAGEETSGTLPAPVTVFLVHRIPESAGNLTVDLWDAQMFGLEGFSNHQRMEVAPMKAHQLTGLMPKEERGYRFRTPSISRPSVLRLSLDTNPLLRDYHVSPGDSIMIMLDEKSASLIFTGSSASKFRLQKELDEVFYEFVQSLDIPLSFNSEAELQAYLDRPGNGAAWDSIATSFGRKTLLTVAGEQELGHLKGIDIHHSILDMQQRLSLYNGSIEARDLQTIYASGAGKIFQLYLNRLSSAYTRTLKLGNSELTQKFRDFIQTQISALSIDPGEGVALDSPSFRDYLLARALLQSDLSESDFFDTIFELYSPEVADRLGVQYLNDVRRRLPDFEHQAKTLDARVMSPEMKHVLREMTGRFGKGAQLYAFDLPTLDGDRIATQDFEGKAMLIDFWITGCGACKSFHERIFDPLIEKYGNHPDLQIISVCSDPTPEYWKLQGGTPNVSHSGFISAFAERSSDVNPLLSHYNIHSYPQLMLVRPDGTLFRLGSVPPTLSEAEALLQEAMKAIDTVKPSSIPSQTQRP
jgi:thiol-disulfide isomerase/thioredoxin